ncbi:immunoglobulin superfamily DCC subclass member 4 [Erpetoichthys calabaricus]|uniref:Immunoglobulin superfamily DCC subclass member 4 n=1 Tax=Erpetoichthys calabaricus TaxID=27687 RepID=A0A8C4THJ9_ERPCA|nr:immunoglobulin superfamily DCC subclass member 4 [Erpetoichthys calabaricus]
MALDELIALCTLSLLLSVADEVCSLEVSCGAGPVSVLLDMTQELVLDCHLAALVQPVNISWLKDGLPVVSHDLLRLLPNGSLHITARPQNDSDGLPTHEGSYTCISTNSFGSIISRTVTVQLSTLSHFMLHPVPQSVPQQGLARFECHVDGLPPPIITWEKDQSPVPSQPRFITLPNGVLQIVNVQQEDTGAYRCVAASASHIQYSQDARLTVTSGPQIGPVDVEIIASPKNTTVIAGRTAVMECMAHADTMPYVSWIRQDGKPITTDAVVLSTNLLISNTQPYHSGVYVCRANKPKTRQFAKAAAELRVLGPPLLSQQPETISRTRASTARFMCKAFGDPMPSIIWMKNGNPILSNGRVKIQSSGSLVINQIGLEDAGYYQCIAKNSLGTACSTAKLTVVVREGLPSSPKQVSVVSMTSTTALVTWERPELNSEQIIGFSVHYQKTLGTENIEYQFAVSNDTTEFQVKDLEPNTNYSFYVVAYSPLGASRMSSSATVQMLEDVPSAPPHLSLLSTSPTEIHVMWLPLSLDLSQGKVTKHRIDYCAMEEDHMYSIEVAGNETQVTLRELKPNQMYKVRIAAGTSIGFGEPSEWMRHSTPAWEDGATGFLFAPSELKVKAKIDSLHVMWQPPPNHSQVSGYKLYYRLVSLEEGKATAVRLRKKVKHYEITGLAPDHLYEVKVLAFSKHKDGYAAVWKGRTQKAPVQMEEAPQQKAFPQPPTGLRATANSSTSIWLQWEKPAFSTVKIVNYTVRSSPLGITNASLVAYCVSSGDSFLLTGLRPFTRYELAVQSNAPGAAGPYSNVVLQSTLPDKPSTSPMGLHMSPLSPSSVLMRWEPPEEPNGIVQEYLILLSINSSLPDSMWTSVVRDGNTFSAEIQGLDSGSMYYFKIAARTVAGIGPYSHVLGILMPSLKRSMPDVLDVHSVTGIIVGVCLGLLCILLCMCVSFCQTKPRSVSQSLSYRKGRSGTVVQQERCDGHELETLMLARPEDMSLTLTEVTEEHSLMEASLENHSLHTEPKPAWNGSVSRNWTSNITSCSDLDWRECTSVKNGCLTVPRGLTEDRQAVTHSAAIRTHEDKPAAPHQVEASVIVHSEHLNSTVKSETDRKADFQEVPSSVFLHTFSEETATCPHSLKNGFRNNEVLERLLQALDSDSTVARRAAEPSGVFDSTSVCDN